LLNCYLFWGDLHVCITSILYSNAPTWIKHISLRRKGSMPSTTAYTLLLSPLFSPSLPVLHAMSGLMLLSLIPTVLLGFSVVLSAAELQRFEHAAKADGSLSLLVVGDWGRRGAYNQTGVALQVTITYNLLLLHIYTSCSIIQVDI